MADHYGVLGVTRSATQQQIKDAYRREARRLHPDVNPDPWAAERFKQVTHAYEVLKDDKRRAEYDAQPRETVSAERNGPAAAPNPDDQTFLFICNQVLQAIKQEEQVLRYSRQRLRAEVYSVAAEMLDKSLGDYDAAHRHPLVDAHRPVIVDMTKRFLDTVNPSDEIPDDRASEHLRSGALGMVGLSRVSPIVGKDASPQAKEAAARSIMFALGREFLKSGLIQPRPSATTVALGSTIYDTEAQNAFIELEAAVGEPLAG